MVELHVETIAASLGRILARTGVELEKLDEYFDRLERDIQANLHSSSDLTAPVDLLSALDSDVWNEVKEVLAPQETAEFRHALYELNKLSSH